MEQIYGTASYVCSAGRFSDLPAPQGDEFALVGRSNVGKSSFINHVCASRNLAKTSKRPGKTVCANVFRIRDGIFWIDLPGYGYAEAARGEQKRWSVLIEEYCSRRKNLAGIIWLVDIRHIGVAIDREACAWLRQIEKPVLAVLTKADKCSHSERNRQVSSFAAAFAGFGRPVVYSTLDHASRQRFWDRFEGWRCGAFGA
jgi:GTP-binding protein